MCRLNRALSLLGSPAYLRSMPRYFRAGNTVLLYRLRCATSTSSTFSSRCSDASLNTNVSYTLSVKEQNVLYFSRSALSCLCPSPLTLYIAFNTNSSGSTGYIYGVIKTALHLSLLKIGLFFTCTPLYRSSFSNRR